MAEKPQRPPSITPERRALLQDLNALVQARELLLEPPVAVPPYTHIDAHAAAMVWRIYSIGRAAGLLGGRPAYEAREMFAHRVRTSLDVSRSFDEWAIALCDKVGITFDKIPLDERMTWRGFTADLQPEDWRGMRNPVRVEDVIAAAALLSDLMYELNHKEAA